MENEKNTEIMNADPPHEIRWYERQFSLDDAKTFIKANITTAARSFIAIGFYLKCVRDRELFLEDGYQSVWEFAKAEYGISMSTASRYMTMNDRFSQDGNSPNVKEEYKAFGKSQLQEMLALTDEQLEQVKPTDRVEDIRGMRKPKEIPYIELPGQHEIEEDFPDIFPDIFPEEEFEISPSPSVQKQEFSMDIAELVEDVPEYAAEAQQIEESIAISQQDPENLSAYGTPIKVYPEGSLLTTPGCEGGHDCFSCHLQCDIRQRYCYCVEAPTGNPFPCDQIDRIDTLREEIGERCQFVNLDQAYHRAGDHEPVPCCKRCKEPCQYACERSIKKREAEEKTPEPEALYFTVENQRTTDGGYGAFLAEVVGVYAGELHSRGLQPMSEDIPDITIQAMGLEYQVRVGNEFVEFKREGNIPVKVERKRLQAEYELWYPAPEPQPRACNTEPDACPHHEGYSCTLTADQKNVPGDGSNCNESCCWECKYHGTCEQECDSSAGRDGRRPDFKAEWFVQRWAERNREDLKTVMRICRKQTSNSERAKAVQKYISPYGARSYGCWEYNFTFHGFEGGMDFRIGRVQMHLKYGRFVTELLALFDPSSLEYDEEIGQLNLSCRSENVLKRAGIDTVEKLISMSDEELTAVRGMSKRAMEEIRKKLADITSADKTEPDPVIDAECEEVPEDRPYTMDMVMTELMRWKDRRESSKPGGTEPSEVMYKKACMMYDAMMALHASMGGEYDEIA